MLVIATLALIAFGFSFAPLFGVHDMVSVGASLAPYLANRLAFGYGAGFVGLYLSAAVPDPSETAFIRHLPNIFNELWDRGKRRWLWRESSGKMRAWQLVKP